MPRADRFEDRPGENGQLRASDADRDRAAAELRQHYTDGRLQADELADRLSQTYAARTHGDLDQLFTDLPSLAPKPGPEARTPSPVAPPPRGTPAWLFPLLAALLIVSALPGAHGLWILWLVVPMILWSRNRRRGGCRGGPASLGP